MDGVKNNLAYVNIDETEVSYLADIEVKAQN